MKKLNFLWFVLSLSLMIGMIPLLNSCQKDEGLDDKGIDKRIANSDEFAEYIIAAIDYQQAVNAFEREIAKVDFLNLAFEKDEDGTWTAYLSDSIRNIQMERKAITMKEKRDLLVCKFPSLNGMDFDEICMYLNYISKTSAKINKKYLEIGLNKNIPITKQGYSEFFRTQSEMLSFVASWVAKSDYVEAYVVIYLNGEREVYIDHKNTDTSSYLPFTYNNGAATRGGSRIYSVFHTHIRSIDPSSADSSMFLKYPALPQGIYYDGVIKYYNLH